MADDDYDLLPHKQITELKRQMQDIKNKVDRSSPKELIDSMDAMTKSIDSLMTLFKQTADEMKYEEKEEILSGGNEHKAMNEKLDKMIEQNKIIADGMVAVSDIVKGFAVKEKKQPSPRPQPGFKPSMSAPSFPQPRFDAPQLPPQPEMQQGIMEEPPLPDLGEEPKPKKGLFGMFNK